MTKVYSTHDEIFTEDSLGDLSLNEGDIYYTGTQVTIKPSELLFNMDTLVELMQEELYDQVGDMAENFDPTEQQKERVFTVLKGAVNNYFDVNCWAVKDVEEHIYTEEV